MKLVRSTRVNGRKVPRKRQLELSLLKEKKKKPNKLFNYS
jgi:hypothetical protein